MYLLVYLNLAVNAIIVSYFIYNKYYFLICKIDSTKKIKESRKDASPNNKLEIKNKLTIKTKNKRNSIIVKDHIQDRVKAKEDKEWGKNKNTNIIKIKDKDKDPLQAQTANNNIKIIKDMIILDQDKKMFKIKYKLKIYLVLASKLTQTFSQVSTYLN